MKRASIVVTNHDHGRYVGAAIESALAQTHPVTDVVVVDDGSTDRSRDVLRRYEDDVTVVYQENQGQAGAMTSGLRRIHGDWVLFLDADDLLDPHAIETAMGVAAPGISRVTFRLRAVDSAGSPTGVLVPPAGNRMVPHDPRGRALRTGGFTGAPTTGNLWAREFAAHVLSESPSTWPICADSLLANLAPLYGKIVAIDAPLGSFRLHDTSHYISRSRTLAGARTIRQQRQAAARALEAHARRLGEDARPRILHAEFRFYSLVLARTDAREATTLGTRSRWALEHIWTMLFHDKGSLRDRAGRVAQDLVLAWGPSAWVPRVMRNWDLDGA